jgi:hypothetical protein
MLRQKNAKAKNDASPALGFGNFNQVNKRSVADPIPLITEISSQSPKSPAAMMMTTSFAFVMFLSYLYRLAVTRIVPSLGKLMRTLKIILLVAVLFWDTPTLAQVATPINSQGISGAPVSVSSSAVAVFLGNVSRLHWGIFVESVPIRSTLGLNTGTGASSAGKGVPTPTTAVGFYLATADRSRCYDDAATRTEITLLSSALW